MIDYQSFLELFANPLNRISKIINYIQMNSHKTD